MIGLLEPKEIEIDGKTFIISKFPAVAGREIITQYIATGMPKVGDYKLNEELMLKLMCYVAVPVEPAPLKLVTKALVDNHMGPGGWETLAKIEVAMMEYNTSFFLREKVSNSLEGFTQKIGEWITRTLTDSLHVSSNQEKRPSTS